MLYEVITRRVYKSMSGQLVLESYNGPLPPYYNPNDPDSDPGYCDLVFKEFSYTPLASISPEIANNTVTFVAPSKTFNMAALATSSVITSNKELKEKFDFVLETIHVA